MQAAPQQTAVVRINATDDFYNNFGGISVRQAMQGEVVDAITLIELLVDAREIAKAQQIWRRAGQVTDLYEICVLGAIALAAGFECDKFRRGRQNITPEMFEAEQRLVCVTGWIDVARWHDQPMRSAHEIDSAFAKAIENVRAEMNEQINVPA